MKRHLRGFATAGSLLLALVAGDAAVAQESGDVKRARSTVVHASCRPRGQSPACGSTIANRGAQRSGGPASKGCSAWPGAVT